MVARPRRSRGLDDRDQHGGGIDLLLAEREPVPAGGAGDGLGPELRPGPGDQDLHRLGRVLRQLLRPQALDQQRRTAPGAQLVREQREQPSDARAGDPQATKGDIGQQRQFDGHQRILGSAGADGHRHPGSR
jgi:hypothetical protein